MSAAPIDSLELRALEERERLHKTAHELKAKVDRAREQLSVAHLVREQFGATSAMVSAVALLLGYAVAGMFTER